MVIGRADGNIQWWAGLWGPGVNAGKVAFILVDSASKNGGNLIGSAVLNDDTWYHVAIVRDGSNNQHRLDVNGVLDAGATVAMRADTYTGNFASDTAALNIGYLDAFAPGGAVFFSGTLDELALFDSAALPADIQQHFDNGDQSAQGYCELAAAPANPNFR